MLGLGPLEHLSDGGLYVWMLDMQTPGRRYRHPGAFMRDRVCTMTANADGPQEHNFEFPGFAASATCRLRRRGGLARNSFDLRLPSGDFSLSATGAHVAATRLARRVVS